MRVYRYYVHYLEYIYIQVDKVLGMMKQAVMTPDLMSKIIYDGFILHIHTLHKHYTIHILMHIMHTLHKHFVIHYIHTLMHINYTYNEYTARYYHNNQTIHYTLYSSYSYSIWGSLGCAPPLKRFPRRDRPALSDERSGHRAHRGAL